MKPAYTNSISISKMANQENQLVELQISFGLSYIESSTQLVKGEPVAVSTRTIEPVASVLLTRGGVATLVKMLQQSLGDEFDDMTQQE